MLQTYVSQMNWTVGVLVFIGGLLIGVLYFWSLWKTIQSLSKVKAKGRILMTSSIIRMTLLILAFFLVAGKNPIKFVIFFVGFMVARFIMLFWQKRKLKK